MKKILIIMHSLGGGGTEKVLITLLKNFDYNNFNIDLCLISKWGVYLKDIPECVRLIPLYDDISSLRTKIEYNLYSRLGIDFLERIRIRKKVDKSYDAIISFSEGRSLKFHSYIADYTNNNITWVHTDMYTNHYTSGANFSAQDELKAYGMMNTIVFVSENARQQFKKAFPQIGIYQKVIVNPIPRDLITSYISPCKAINTKFTITCVGGLRKVKAFDRVIRLAVRLKQKCYDFQVSIIGDGDCRSELEKMIECENVNDCVRLLGFVTPPYQELSKSDLFLNVSIAEGYPLVICEAMCLGIPVVSTKTAGSMELLGDSEYGLLVEQNDESILVGVERIMNDDKLRTYYHEKALERADSFDIGEIMQRVYSLMV